MNGTDLGSGGPPAPPRLTRRRAVGALLVLAAAAGLVPVPVRADAPAGALLSGTASALGRVRCFAALGRRIGATLNPATAGALVAGEERRLAARLHAGEPPRAAVAGLIAADFRAGRVVTAGGWRLSRVEAALCLAAAARGAPGAPLA